MYCNISYVKFVLAYNPFLFNYRLSCINQKTKDYGNEATKLKTLQQAGMEYSTYQNISNLQDVNQLTFKPNYNMTNEIIETYTSLGIQVTSLHLSFIKMFYPVYDQNKEVTFEYNTEIVFDGLKRYNINKLWCGYNNLYHPIIGYVEVNIDQNGSGEHPMCGVFTNSYMSQYIWTSIDNLFNNKVMPYIEHRPTLV